MLTIMPTSSDIATVASIGVIAYILGNLLHEGLGHAGACIITGGKAISLTAVAMDCSAENRLVIAGGTIMNTVAGLVFFLLGRLAGRDRAHLKYFLWISMTINLMEAAALDAVEALLPDGHQSLGIKLDVSHHAATPVGMRVVATARLVRVEGRRLHFAVEARDEKETIGDGSHERVVVNVARFDERVQKKLATP